MMSTPISVEDIVFLGIVSIVSGFQLARFARRVGNARLKYKVSPPETTGDPAFIRHFRAQQNSLEFHPIFMVCLWVSGIFFNQVFAALVGLFYLYSRQQYFDNYIIAAEKRVLPFKRTVLALKMFIGLSFLGLLNASLLYFKVVNLKEELSSRTGIRL